MLFRQVLLNGLRADEARIPGRGDSFVPLVLG